MSGRWVWVSTPRATFVVLVEGGRIRKAPPIVEKAMRRIGRDEKTVADFYRDKGGSFVDLTARTAEKPQDPVWQVQVTNLSGAAPNGEEQEDLLRALPESATVVFDSGAGVLTAVFPAPGPGIAAETFRCASRAILGPQRGEGALRVRLAQDKERT